MAAVAVYIFLVIAALNYKTLPFAWFLSLAWHVVPKLRRRIWSQSTSTTAQDLPHSSSRNPLFEPVSMFSLCTLTEMDHNLHKSNSTFFADVDISRAKVLFSLISPALLRKGPENILRVLEAERHKGKFGVVLGAVHMSFCKEIKPYQAYEVESRITGWDQKWLVIETVFWRPWCPKKAACERVLLGKAVSKFVFKKGRFTVAPERVFRAAGLIMGTSLCKEASAEVATVGEKREQWITGKAELDSSWHAERVEEQRSRGLEASHAWLDFSSQLLEQQ